MRSTVGYATAAACLLLLAGACATNPITGRRQMVLSSAEQETEAGANQAKRVGEEMGLLDDPNASRYVAVLGDRLVRSFPSHEFKYTFNVVDVPEPNAFALPGGFIYVSRGLLALVNSEDELVTVLGHEIGHVAARHASRRLTVAAPFAVVTGLTSFATSIVSPSLGNLVAGLGGLTGDLVVAPYSREQEREADRLGMELAARAGWKPEALSKILDTMEREERLHGGTPDRFSFLASHPSTPERVRDTATEAARLRVGVHTPVEVDRRAVLGRLDGLVIGDDPANGVFAGPRFLHPKLRFAIDFPAGWKTHNERAYVTAIAPAGDAVSLLRSAGNSDNLSATVDKTATGLGYDARRDVEWTTIAGNKAAHLQAEGRADDGTPVQLDFTWIGYRDTAFEIVGLCSRDGRDKYANTLHAVAQSFRPLSAAEGSSIRVKRLRLKEARYHETVAALAASMPSAWSAEEIAVVNGIGVDQPLGEGFTVKVASQEPFRSAAR